MTSPKNPLFRPLCSLALTIGLLLSPVTLWADSGSNAALQMVQTKKTVSKKVIEYAIEQSRKPSRHGTKQSYKSVRGDGGTTMFKWSCFSTTKDGQQDCESVGNNLAASGCTCSSIKKGKKGGGSTCDCPEGED